MKLVKTYFLFQFSILKKWMYTFNLQVVNEMILQITEKKSKILSKYILYCEMYILSLLYLKTE